MSPKHHEITYDAFYQTAFKERQELFGSITANNRALLVKTHAERWLGSNRLRLTAEQVESVDDMISSISSKWYEADRNFAEIEPVVEALMKGLEAVLSPEEVRQLVSPRAEYIPVSETTE